MPFSYLFIILYYDQCPYYTLNYKNYLLISNKMKENSFLAIFFKFFYLSDFHTEHGAQTHRVCMLFPLSQPDAPIS